jgi:hypothetical protein
MICKLITRKADIWFNCKEIAHRSRQHLSILFTRVKLLLGYLTVIKGLKLTGITPVAKLNRAHMNLTCN